MNTGSRTARRARAAALKKHADTVADIMASTSLQKGDWAGVVSNPTARKVLTRGYAKMIRNRCKPVVLRLTPAEAESLPGSRRALPGADWFAAFGLDVDGRGTWVSRWVVACGLPPEEVRDAIEVRLLTDLARACNSPGFPVMEAQR